jgi:hypothetical protein
VSGDDREAVPDEIEALFVALDIAREMLSFEEREMVGDALLEERDEGPMSPNARKLYARVQTALAAIADGDRDYWRLVAAEDINEPEVTGTSLSEMSRDDLERIREHLQKFRPRKPPQVDD